MELKTQRYNLVSEVEYSGNAIGNLFVHTIVRQDTIMLVWWGIALYKKNMFFSTKTKYMFKTSIDYLIDF